MHYVEEADQPAMFLLLSVNLTLFLEIVHCARSLQIIVNNIRCGLHCFPELTVGF